MSGIAIDPRVFESELPLIDVQTISEYVIGTSGDLQGMKSVLDYSDLPCVTPPFGKLEMKFKVPAATGASLRSDGRGFDMERLELLAMGLTVEDHGSVVQIGSVGSNPISMQVNDYDIWIPVDAYGKPSGEARATVDGRDFAEIMDEQRDDHGVRDRVLTSLFAVHRVGATALAFMHAKGARIEEPDHPSRQVRRAWSRASQKIYTLKVEPLDRAMREAREASGSGVAVHMVRGTWCDYSQGPGVGGNPNARGIYWRSPHVRGNPRHGIVAKQYETGRVE
jgi:hypothetical protein